VFKKNRYRCHIIVRLLYILILVVIFFSSFLFLPVNPIAAATSEKVFVSDMSVPHYFQRYDTDGTESITIYDPPDDSIGKVSQAAVDLAKGKVYFWDPAADKIYISNIDGSDRTTWLDTTLTIWGLSAYNGIVYYCPEDAVNGFYWRSEDGLSNGTIATYGSSGDWNTYTAVDPEGGYLFYDYFDASADKRYIYRTDLANPKGPADGGTQILMMNHDIWSLDAYDSKVYIGYGNEIETPDRVFALWRMDYDGTDLVEIYDPTGSGSINEIAVAPNEGKLYFYVSDENNIYKIDLNAALPVVAPPVFLDMSTYVLEIYSPPPGPEINIKQGVTDIADGDTYNIGNKETGSITDISFTIENTGAEALNLTGDPRVALTGDTASFSITMQPSTPVAASGSTSFTVRFAPATTGLKTASISIANDDSDENPYNITLNGTGIVAPAISNLNGDSVTFYEGTAVILDSGGNTTVSDADATGYNSGNVTVSISGATANEDLSIRTGSGVTLSAGMTAGSTVTVSGTTIGTIDSTGQNGANLVIDLNATATDALLSTLLRNITYNNDLQDPSGSRTVNLTVSDALQTSATSSVTVTIVGLNDAPTLSATGLNPTFTEGGAATDLFSTVSISTVESGQSISELSLTVTNVNNGTDEVLSIDGSDVALTDGNSLTTATNGMSITVSVTGTTATVTISKAGGISTATMQTLIDGMTYINNSQNPNISNRVVTLTSITDTGGTANGGTDTATLAVSSTVTITAVNDRPVVNNVDGDTASVVAGGESDFIDHDNNAAVSDIDSADFNGGNLTIGQVAGMANGNFSFDGVNVTSGGDATIAATETVSVGGTTVGTVNAVSDGQGGHDLIINFNAGATTDRVQTLIRNIKYAAPSGLGDRAFSLTVTDGDGTAGGGNDTSVTAVFTITVTPNPPVITNLDGDSIDYDTVTAGQALLDEGSDAEVTDPDSANFNGGNLTATISAGSTAAEDRLGISTTGVITLSAGVTAGSIVSVSGTEIGTITADGSSGNDLIITFNANSTPARVTQLLRALTYENDNTVNPASASRTVEITVTDAGSSAATSGIATVTVNMLLPEINLKQGTTNIPDGGNYDFGDKQTNTDTDVIFTIENTGTTNLTLTTPLIIGGANADQFSIQAQPVSPVTAGNNTGFTVRFSPTATGIKTATIAIANNDGDESTYDLTIQGNGTAQPPPPQPQDNRPPTMVDTGYQLDFYSTSVDVTGNVNKIVTDFSGRVKQPLEISSADGKLTFYIPRDTLITDSNGNRLHNLRISLYQNPPAGSTDSNVIALVYKFEPDGATFSPPIIVKYRYTHTDIPQGVAEDNLAMAYYNESTHSYQEFICTTDCDNNVIVASVPHFCGIALVNSRIPSAPVFAYSDLLISNNEAAPGEDVTITVTAQNMGSAPAKCSLKMKLNGMVVANKNLEVGSGMSEITSFTINTQVPGSYQVDVNGLKGDYRVTTDKTAPSNHHYNWWFIGLILASLLAIAGILLWQIILRRKINTFK
jgi:hypothetical protein